jgi:hypothetical protein
MYQPLLNSCSIVDQLLTFTISNQTSITIGTGFPIGTI